MNKPSIFTALLSGMLILLSQYSFGQFTVVQVKNQNVNTTGNGFYYSLPQTVLKVNIVYEETRKIRGPFADYTQEYLGTGDYIKTNSNNYKVLNVEILPEVQADPSQFYYVTLSDEKAKDEAPLPAFHLTPFGTLLALDDMENKSIAPVPAQLDQTFIVMQGDDDFRYQADYHRKKKVDTVTRRISIDTVNIEQFLFKTTWVDKTPEDKADEAAHRIADIRNARFNLLTGYQEINYGESMRYMDGQLKNLENQYLELFLGKQLKTVSSQTVYFTPASDKINGNLLELPDGSVVKIKIIPRGVVSKLPAKPQEKLNSLYYRIPEEAVVEIEFDDEIIFRTNILINQLGVITTIPGNQTRVRFDPLTGSVIKFVSE